MIEVSLFDIPPGPGLTIPRAVPHEPKGPVDPSCEPGLFEHGMICPGPGGA